MVEWSDARPSSWVTHAGLGTSAQDLVTAFNMSKPGVYRRPSHSLAQMASLLQPGTDKAHFGMQTLAYSCVEHLRRGSAHLRDSSRRVLPSRSTAWRNGLRGSLPPPTRRLGAAR